MHPALPVVYSVVSEASRFAQEQRKLDVAEAVVRLEHERNILDIDLARISSNLEYERMELRAEVRKRSLELQHEEKMREYELVEQALQLAAETRKGKLENIKYALEKTCFLVDRELEYIRNEIKQLNCICYSKDASKLDRINAKKQINQLRQEYHNLIAIAECSRLDTLFHTSNI